MVYAVQLSVNGLTQAQATAAATAIRTRLTAKSRWDVESVGAAKMLGETTWGVCAEARYVTRANLDSVSAAAHTWLDANAPAAAHGTLSVHDCTHDGDGPCPTPTVIWSK
jgi:hypothetical protein